MTAIFFNIGFFVLQAVYVPMPCTISASPPLEIGATLATYGIGMVSAALLAPRIARALPFGAVIAIGPLAGLAASLVMVATIWVPSVALAALSFFLIGAGPILWTIGSTTLRQSVTPERMLGRVSALITMATFGARPIGAALGALVGASPAPRAASSSPRWASSSRPR